MGSVVLGLLAGSGASPVLVLAALLAPAVLAGTLLRPDLGLLVLVLMVFTRLSDVAVAFHSTPSVLQPFLLLLVISLAVRSYRLGVAPSGMGLPMALFAGYGAVLSLSLFFAPDFEAANLSFTSYVRDAVVALLAVALVREAKTLERVVWVLIGAGGLLAALGVYQYLTGNFGQNFGGFAQARVLNIAAGKEDYRISGPIEDANHWAQALLVVVPLALGRLHRSRTRWGKAAAGAALPFLLAAVFFTFSRGALLALVVVGLVACVLRPPPAWAVALVAVCGVLLLPVVPSAYVQRVGQLAGALTGLEGGQTGEASLSGRLSAIRAGEQMIRENPVVGVGLGQFQTAYPDYSRGQGVNTVVNGVEPHNLFLEVAAETGYLGVVGFAALVGTALFRLWRGRRELRAAGHRRPADLVEDVLLGLLAYLMSGMFVHNAYPRFFWLLIGIALAVPYVVTDVLRRADALAGEARPAGAGPRLRQPAGVR